MRRARGRRTSELRRQSVDYLGVNLPSEAGVSQDPTVTRKSMASVDLLQNPFSAEDDGDERERGRRFKADWTMQLKRARQVPMLLRR